MPLRLTRNSQQLDHTNRSSRKQALKSTPNSSPTLQDVYVWPSTIRSSACTSSLLAVRACSADHGRITDTTNYPFQLRTRGD